MIEEVIAYAKRKLGFKEVKGNMGFEDPVFDTIMRQNGFQDSWAWCMLFTKSCYTVPTFSGKSKVLPAVEKAFTPGAVKSYYNAASMPDSFYARNAADPKVGDIIIWQNYKNGKAHWTGHAALIVKVNGAIVETIEGNTNSQGGREGFEVAEMSGVKRHDLNHAPIANGLNFLGLITVLN
jgi:hypothetical protein